MCPHHGLRGGTGKKASAMACNFMRPIKSSDMVFWSCCPVTGAVLLFISIFLSFIVPVCLFCNSHVHVYSCGSMVSGMSYQAVSSCPHREGNPRLLPVQALRVRPDIRIVAFGLLRRRQRPDGHGHIFLQRQYAPTGSECFWRILHDMLHFPKIIQYDIVYFRSAPEEFLQILVIRVIVFQQVVFLFPGIGVGYVTAA